MAVALLRLLLMKAVTLLGLPQTASALLPSWLPLRGFSFRQPTLVCLCPAFERPLAPRGAFFYFDSIDIPLFLSLVS